MPGVVRIRLLTGVLWILVASGPLLGGLSLARAAGAVPADSTPAVQVVPPGVEALAELAVAAHLGGPPASVPDRLAPAHPALRLGPDPLGDLSQRELDLALETAVPVLGVASVGVEPAGPGRFGVQVVVLTDTGDPERPGGFEGWQVTIADTASGLAVETVPALVAVAPLGAVPEPGLTALGEPDANNPVAQAAGHFLRALLSGDGELGRYLAADAEVVAPTTPAFEHVALRRLATRGLDPGRLVVLAEVRGTRPDGRIHLMQYPLLMTQTDGRWEVLRILPALPLANPERSNS